MMKKNNKRSEKNKEITMTIAVTPRAARCNGVKGNTYGEGLNVHDSRFMILGRAKRKVNGQIQLDMIDFKMNHVYVDKSDRAQEWAGLKDCDTATEEHKNRLAVQVEL